MSYGRKWILSPFTGCKNEKLGIRLGGGHSKSTFVEEGRGSHWKANNTEQGEGVLACVYIRFFKKNAEIFKMKFFICSPVFPIDYDGSMKY